MSKMNKINPGVCVEEAHPGALSIDLASLPKYLEAEPRKFTEEEFFALCGRWPENDDLDRLNCPDAGFPGHLQCGLCLKHSVPLFVCGCLAPSNAASGEVLPAIDVYLVSDGGTVNVDIERIQGLSETTWLNKELEFLLPSPATPQNFAQIKAKLNVVFSHLANCGKICRHGSGRLVWGVR